MNDNETLLRDLDWAASGIQTFEWFDAEEAAKAIRALEKKVLEAEAALFDAKADVMQWQTYMAWMLKFASDQHDTNIAEIATLRSDRDRLAADLDAAIDAARGAGE